MKELLTYIVQNLVEKPDEVSVTEREANGETVFEVRVADGDMGKVIGRQGRIVKEIRILMKAVAQRKGKTQETRCTRAVRFLHLHPKRGAMHMQKPYLEAGKIVNTHGVRGEVRIQPWADDAAFLLGFRTFYIDGAPVHVAHSRVHKGMLVVKFADYDDVNAAMTLKNRVVQGAREVLIPDRPEFVCSIDPAAGRMVVHLIEGM